METKSPLILGILAMDCIAKAKKESDSPPPYQYYWPGWHESCQANIKYAEKLLERANNLGYELQKLEEDIKSFINKPSS